MEVGNLLYGMGKYVVETQKELAVAGIHNEVNKCKPEATREEDVG